MVRKSFSELKADVANKRVRLTFYKSTPFFSSTTGKRTRPIIRVYRKTEPDFEFGKDYAEFFNGSDHRNAKRIFMGPLTEFNHRKYEFIDKEVAVCRTYSYWVALSGLCYPTGPVPVRVRDPEVWWPQEKIERYMDTILGQYKGYVQKKKFGTTVKGNEINGLIAGNRRRMIAFIGTVHAGESGPELLLPALKKILKNNRNLLDETGIAVLPSVNIDERERLVHGCPWYLRCNATGGNFDAKWSEVEYGYGLISSDPDSSTYRGKSPESEPETKGVVKFINEVKPVAVVSFHALASICGACFIFSKYATGDARFRKKSEILAKAYTEGMYPGEKKEIKLSPACSAGSLSTWLYLKKGIYGFDLEHDGAKNAEPSLTDLTTPELVREYQKRHYHGIICVLKELGRKKKDET